jgi:3-isopropylmalate/(R)-2-methylmalate dehydratase small subunit
MEAFVAHTGVAAPLLRDNVDTDVIIPSREMKRVSKKGLGEGLFANLRYTAKDRAPNPDFVLNQPTARGTTILLAGRNFGCGSSREHAVWALAEFGIRAIIAESFGAIFHDNCIANGLLPCVLAGDAIARIAQWTGEDPQANRVRIDLEALCVVAGPLEIAFQLDGEMRRRLLGGLSSIDVTLEQRADIEAFLLRPWVYSTDPPHRTSAGPVSSEAGHFAERRSGAGGEFRHARGPKGGAGNGSV